MIKIITKKRLNDLECKIESLERSGIWTENELNKERNWRMNAEKLNGELNYQIDNLEKKVNDQREIIVNMMILLDFFSQKLLRKHNKKGGKNDNTYRILNSHTGIRKGNPLPRPR